MTTATPPFPPVTFERWRALVERDLAGKPFDKTLAHSPLEGVSVAPLYTEAPALDAAARFARTEPFRICMRHPAGASAESLKADIDGGADALWLPLVEDLPALPDGTIVLEADEVPASVPENVLLAVSRPDLASLAKLAARRKAPTALVSTIPFHDAGADAADEVAIALATGVSYLEALLAAGMSVDAAAAAIWFRVAVGRDTFVELCKLRALRETWAKVLTASGGAAKPALVHAVCSAQTLTVRDPWVNMLRVTTQVFAAVTGGADLVTPNAFDDAFGLTSPLGRRVARNTGLVLREESALGKVSDPAGGSYYFDSLTDLLARQGWTRFQTLMKGGGIARALESGALAKELEGKWQKRLDRVAKRKDAILGVSDFANLGETLPHTPPRHEAAGDSPLPAHRDSEAFEQLRLQADVLKPEVVLLTLGTFAESRARAGFAANFFGAGGMHSHETTTAGPATVVCLCGTDERYAADAAACATELKKAGAKHVLLAGRPGALENDFRTAGVDGFVYVGCDVIALLGDVLGQFKRTA